MGQHSAPTASGSEPPSLLTPGLIILQHLGESILSTAQTTLDAYISPARRTAFTARVKSFAQTRPLLSSFLLAHILCSGLPIVLFTLQILSVLLFSLATVLIVGVLCALAFTAVCVGFVGLVLVPVLLVTGFVGCAVWFWMWVGWYGLRWAGVVRQEGESSVALHKRERGVVKEEGDNGNGSSNGTPPGH